MIKITYFTMYNITTNRTMKYDDKLYKSYLKQTLYHDISITAVLLHFQIDF